MTRLELAEKEIDVFIEKNVFCATCIFFEKELFGGFCGNTEVSVGFLENGDSMCEGHEFRDKRLEETLEEIQDKYMDILLPEIEASLLQEGEQNERRCRDERTAHHI
jgi:hypothetical protein